MHASIRSNHSIRVTAAQKAIRRPEFLGEDFRQFPCREVPAREEPVVMDELGERPLGPAPRGLIDFVREVLTATGVAMCLTSKNASLFSQ